MKTYSFSKIPDPPVKWTIRILVILGVISILNFFYWFVRPELITNRFLFWLLLGPMAYDSIRMIYIWYHYWDISVPVKPESTRKFTVDVLTTYFPGEPYEMIKNTLLAIRKMNYPHTAYLCDEANDPELIRFCQAHGIVHVTRNNRINAKAGNINNALKQATGDICLILDPDHVPKENFLDEVVPYFEDENVGFVQTVQGYYNVQESLVAQGAAEQTFQFYGPLMMTMNSYGTVNAIGANCVFRRKALDSIGGHAAGLSEDMHTAMQLHAKGWKSVYVPETFTKGLVPSTLTAYYKQQLKWARGTLELLVATYPKLFRNFTWRQKIHYGLLPLHYMAGFFILLSILIPVISLFTATIPWKGNVINFGLMVLPIFSCSLGIRFYVQRWLADKSERGLHITGGVLLMCAWWIFLLGAVYTFIRKKVPYLPTPKDDKEGTDWKILIPNFVTGIISLIAVPVGLAKDFTPFTIVMSGFALMNAFVMFYTYFLAYEKLKPVTFSFDYKSTAGKINSLLQNNFYKFWTRAALPVTFFLILSAGGIYYQTEYVKWLGVKPEKQNKNSINYVGIFAPGNNNSPSRLNEINRLTNETGGRFDIVSLYMGWEMQADNDFPDAIIDSIYMQKSIPMITWDPWEGPGLTELQTDEKHIFEWIVAGNYDGMIARFADRLKQLQKPVFLRFASEFDNPLFPWFVSGDNAPEKFKNAWIHTYEIFKNRGAINVIWVWNPWKPENVTSYYPGKDYVDWFGVNVLNYEMSDAENNDNDFYSLYKPFHNEFKKLPQTPVMLAEFKTLNEGTQQAEWLENAFHSIENDFNEIKSVIYFYHNVEPDWSDELIVQTSYSAEIKKGSEVNNSFSKNKLPDYLFSDLPELKVLSAYAGENRKVLSNNIKGINLNKRKDWRQDYQVLNRHKLLSDFEQIKQAGLNTIQFEGHTVYEYNILRTSEECNLNVSYGFWIPEDIDFISDSARLNKLKNDILKRVAGRKHHKHIISWNIRNDVLYNQKDHYLKPVLLYQNAGYILWLKDLVAGIKEIDPTRPLVVDIEVNPLSVYHTRMLLGSITDIDVLGLVVKKDKYLGTFASYLDKEHIDYLFSEINVDVLSSKNKVNPNVPFYVTAWQDQHESNKLSFNGLTDRKGRNRYTYFKLRDMLQETKTGQEFPKIRILKPSALIYEDMTYEYNAMVYTSENKWQPGFHAYDYYYEWSLVKCDVYGNPLAVKDIGTGPQLLLKIPKNYEYFKLLLTVGKGDCISTTLSQLHTPIQRTDESAGNRVSRNTSSPL